MFTICARRVGQRQNDIASRARVAILHVQIAQKVDVGLFGVICARLFGLSYANYLRMCRDCFGAEIMGKNSMYPVAYFKRSKELDAVIDNLNARANMVLWEREHPDYDEHAAYVKEHNPRFYKEVTENVSND